MRVALACAVLLLSTAASAQPADRSAQLRQLAETLGRQHYLRTLCNGPDDQTWRTRMTRLLDLDGGGDAVRLQAAFNRGFTALTARIPACGTAARVEASANARRGAELAAALRTVRTGVGPPTR